MFLSYCSYLKALSHTNNIAGFGCKDNRNRIALMILIKVENRQMNCYPWFYTILFSLFLLTYSALIPVQRWSRGLKARVQGHKKIPRPRPRTDSLEAKAKGTGTSVLRKKRPSKIFFKRSPKTKKNKKGLQNFFSGDFQKKTSSKKCFRHFTKF